MNNQKYPYIVGIYKGEGRFLFIPYVSHVRGGRVESDKCIYLEETSNSLRVGENAFAAIDMIESSSLDKEMYGTAERNILWKKNSKYKSWNSFWENNNHALLLFFEDGHFKVASKQRSETIKGHYDNCIKILELPSGVTAHEVGEAICEVFRAAEEFHGSTQNEKTEKVIKLLDKTTIIIQTLEDSHFEDCGEGSAAEIYQCYSYIPKENADSSAEIFLGIAAELDCNIEPSNIHIAWEEIYGKADVFEVQDVDYGIFKLRVEMRNKHTHKISYLLQMEENLLLECGLDVHQPNRRKKLDDKLVQEFETFALNCRF